MPGTPPPAHRETGKAGNREPPRSVPVPGAAVPDRGISGFHRCPIPGWQWGNPGSSGERRGSGTGAPRGGAGGFFFFIRFNLWRPCPDPTGIPKD